MPKPPISATLKWAGGSRFTAKTAKSEITIDGDSDAGPSPPEALAIALAGCMAIDVADIVRKGRHPLTALDASIVGQRVDTQPHRFHTFTLHFLVTGAVPDAAVDRAIKLSHDKYCSVWHSLRQDIEFHTTFEVRPERPFDFAQGRPEDFYLDWLRGVAVIIMVEAHVVDAWTREADRHDRPYMYAVFIAGLAAPLFLFLAGLAQSMAASARSEKVGIAAAAAQARYRGGQVFALAFLFRAQSQLLGWGAWSNFLKVDILNVMGLAMVASGALWSLGRTRETRIALFAIATMVVTMTTPLVRAATGLAILPDPIEAYIRPVVSLSNFALFPWAAFLFAGAIVGELVAAARQSERFLQLGLFVAGALGIGLGYWASFQPSIYPVANFWTSSPTFFFIRLGICAVMVPIAWMVTKKVGITATLGRSSLFVYWIHVEMVYGALGRPFRRLLPLGASITAWVILCLVLYAIVLWKNRMMETVKLTGAFKIFAPVLK